MEPSLIYGEVFRNLGPGTELETGILRRRASRRGNSRRVIVTVVIAAVPITAAVAPMYVVSVTSMVASVIISSGMDGGVTGARVGGDHSETPRLG